MQYIIDKSNPGLLNVVVVFLTCKGKIKIVCRGNVFSTLSKTYDGDYLRRELTAKSCELFLPEKLHHRCLAGY